MLEEANVLPSLHKKPNIIWVVLDHVTFRHYKMTNGAKPILNTYERIASKGVEFTQCRSVHPLCMPARATMLTGMYAHNHGITRNGKHTDCTYPLFSECLVEAGYKVGYFGKNHSGFENLAAYGFEGYYPHDYGNPYKTEEYKQYLEKNGLANPIYHQEWGIIHKYENGNYDLTESNNFNTYTAGYIKTPGPVHEADFLTSMALDWMEEQFKEDSPFSVRIDMWGPHHAFQVPLEYKDSINEKEIEEYPSFNDEAENKPPFVQEFLKTIKESNSIKTWEEWQPIMKRAYENYSYIDNVVGKLLDSLEQKGIAENTIIIYTADHGDALGSHGGMVDKAGDMMEEVMHIPMVISWPGVTTGSRSEALVSNLDLVPTVLDMAGIVPPKYMDGKSMVGLLKEDRIDWREDFMAEHYGHFKVYAPQRALYYKNYKYIACDGDKHEFYDIKKDPFELNDLFQDPSMKDIVNEMKKRLLDYMSRHGDDSEDVKGLRTEIGKMRI